MFVLFNKSRMINAFFQVALEKELKNACAEHAVSNSVNSEKTLGKLVRVLELIKAAENQQFGLTMDVNSQSLYVGAQTMEALRLIDPTSASSVTAENFEEMIGSISTTFFKDVLKLTRPNAAPQYILYGSKLTKEEWEDLNSKFTVTRI